MGECRTNAENIRIEPVYAAWEEQELVKVTAKADVMDSLHEKYFLFSTPTTEYLVWFNTGMGAAPVVAGKTAIEVEIDTGDSASTVAEEAADAISAVSGVHAAVDGCDATSFYIQAAQSGAVLATAADGPAMSDTDFDIDTVRVGGKLEMGAFEGDIEVALTENLVDVTSHQTGAQILTALRNGRNIDNITLPLLESEVEKLKTLISASGALVTPAGGTEVAAWGSEDSKAFDNIAQNCRKLVLHPVRRAASDLVEDMCFFRAYPLISGITLSGESARIVNVEFKIIPDQFLRKDARVFVYGDHTQDFLNT